VGFGPPGDAAAEEAVCEGRRPWPDLHEAEGKSVTSYNKKTAILLLTHVNNRRTTERLLSIVRECSRDFDAFILCDNTNHIFDRYRTDEKYFLFDLNTLMKLGYPGKTAADNLLGSLQSDHFHQRFNFNPGNVELPVLRFFKERSHYDYYWIVEYDVRFSGSWNAFFSAFAGNRSDLLGTTLTRYEKSPVHPTPHPAPAPGHWLA
jgi:hypothetical protein